MATEIRKVIEVIDTPIESNNGRKLVKRVEKIQMPNGRYRYPARIIDMTPGFRRVSEEEIIKSRSSQHQFSFG